MKKHLGAVLLITQAVVHRQCLICGDPAFPGLIGLLVFPFSYSSIQKDFVFFITGDFGRNR